METSYIDIIEKFDYNNDYNYTIGDISDYDKMLVNEINELNEIDNTIGWTDTNVFDYTDIMR